MWEEEELKPNEVPEELEESGAVVVLTFPQSRYCRTKNRLDRDGFGFFPVAPVFWRPGRLVPRLVPVAFDEIKNLSAN